MFQVKWLWECLEGKRKLYCFAMFLSAAASVILIVNPTLARMFVDKVVVGTENPDGTVFHDTALLLPLLAGMIGAAVFRSAMRYGMILLYENTSQGLLFKIRTRVYANLCAQDMSFYDRIKTGDLMTRLTGDLDLVRHTVSWIVYNIIESALIFTIAIIYFFSLNTVMTLSMLAITPFLFITTFCFSKTVRPFYASLREKLALMNSRAQENISANRIVRAFAREDYETAVFDERNEDYRAANIRAQRQWLKFFPAIEAMAQLMNVIVLFVGGFLIIKDKLTPGELASFTAMTWCISMPMRNLGMLLNDIQRFFVSADKVIELYYSKPVIKDPEDAYEANMVNGVIDFDNVSFRYQNNTNALSNINLHIKKGMTVAVMGPTGSGKTTLVNLITRLADASEGTVSVDGVDVKKWSLNSLRSHIGMAAQEVFLFSDTVDSNIAFGNVDLSEKEVRHYANVSAADFIDHLSDGYDTIIGERGTGLSGGQKQRVALARALAIKPSILILDDTTSAVDLETEKYIQEQLKNLDFDCTKIIIAQRISSVKQSDMIVIMEDGKIADYGTHEELLSRDGGYYKDIYNLQYAENQNERGNV